MRARVIGVIGTVLALVVGVVLWLNGGTSEKTSSALAPKTVKVGAIDVRIEPHHIDATGALVKVTLDTHTTDLDMPLSGTLDVDGVTWQGGNWTGDPPSGHHRAGEFRFRAAGSPTGAATFTLGGFDDPVSAQWSLRDGK
ncbi:MAG: hypothetical protein WEB06_10730 [Actinomycetota bacterium]